MVPHPLETTDVHHPSESEAPINTKVTPQTTIEALVPYTTSEAPVMDDMKVTPPVEIEVTSSALTGPSIHMDEGFPDGPSDCSMLTRYADHVAFRL